MFQEVVAIIHEHLAEGATVEESAMLVNRVTGRQREVDVVVRTNAASHEVVVGIEVTRAGRKATVEWVERMGKHQNLPTDKLVLVAVSGFRHHAGEAARAAGVATIEPEDLDADDPALQVLEQCLMAARSLRCMQRLAHGLAPTSLAFRRTWGSLRLRRTPIDRS
jgi:hypothetical protein